VLPSGQHLRQRNFSGHSSAQYDLAALVVGEKDGPRIHSAAGSFAYHPGMAVLRLKQLKRGATEHLLTALDLRSGKRVLDATLGLAAALPVAFLAVVTPILPVSIKSPSF